MRVDDMEKSLDVSDQFNLEEIPPREKLVTTAVKFLSNPNVRRTTIGLRKGFLKKKGLTEKEIELAFKKLESFENEQAIANYDANNKHIFGYRTSFWIKAKDVANMVALIAIGSYSLYSMWKLYIAPRIFGIRSNREEKYHELSASIVKLNESVTELKELIRNMQPSASRSSQELLEVKNELKAIKGLLLGRSQFPNPSSSIPSWQIVGVSGSGAESDKSDDLSSRRRKTKTDRKKDDSDSRSGTDSVVMIDKESIDDDSAPAKIRKHPSVDSNNGFQSGSSCEVVFLGKNDSDPDHSDD